MNTKKILERIDTIQSELDNLKQQVNKADDIFEEDGLYVIKANDGMLHLGVVKDNELTVYGSASATTRSDEGTYIQLSGKEFWNQPDVTESATKLNDQTLLKMLRGFVK